MKFTRHNICLNPGEYQRMQVLYGNNTAAIIRGLISNHLKRAEEKQEKVEIKLDD